MMIPADVLTQAVAALTAHRLRATLSAIGIVFGVATVVAAIAIGEGARREAFAQIGALGIDNVFVRAVRREAVAGSSATRRQPPAPSLTMADARVLADAIPALNSVAALRTIRTEAISSTHAARVQLIGATVAWRQIVQPALLTGRWLAEDDVRERRRVAVIGADAAMALFGGAPALGGRVRAAGNWYQIVGLIGDRPGTAAKPSPLQRVQLQSSVVVPVTAMDASLGEGDALDRVDEIAVRAASDQDVGRVASIVASVMGRRHADATDYEIVVPRELLQARLRAQRTFNGVLIGIGGLALLISGIGIMNIMIASVAERTQEIGVRRAFGARRHDVVAQFAAEAALLCIAGGVVGLPVGAGLAGVIALLAGWPVSVSMTAVLLALVLSTTVGLVFGVYPARLAAAVQPVDALRAP